MSVLSSLVNPPSSAVIVPVESASLSPGSARWEAFFQPLRSASVDIFGLYPIVGPMHERDALRSPHYVAAHGSAKDRAAIEEGALRLRAWLYSDAPSYDQVVFLSGGSLATIWSRGVAGTPQAARVRIIPVRSRAVGFARSTVQDLPGLESVMVKTRLRTALGRA